MIDTLNPNLVSDGEFEVKEVDGYLLGKGCSNSTSSSL